ncbi:MAG: PAS domain S-box protein, partial [Clostridia bacterium]|nr:PAS domain S-box protein [Clostridia bacterium]
MIDRRIFDTLFDKVQMGVFITDADGYFMYVNPMACNMTGYGINEIIGMNRMDLVPKEHKDAAAASFADLKEGKESDSKVCYKTKSGDIRMWGLKSMKVDNDTYVALTEDITELESLITENKKNLNRLKLAGETGKVGSWEYDVRSETFWRSEEAVRQFTGKAEESTSKLDEVEEYLVKKGSLRKAIDLMVRGKKDADKEFEIIDADGNKKVLKTYGRIIMDGDEVSKIIGATVDITEMKEVQAQVTDEKNRLRSYLDIAEVILLVLDNNGKVMMINKKGCEVLGYDEKDILGKSWTDNFIPTYLKKQIEDIHRDNIFKNEESHEKFENPVINSMGEERLISWKNTIIKDKEGIIIGSLSSGRDVTDERRIEKALKESEASLKKAEIMTGSGHFERDLETNISKWSDGMYILLGYEPQSFEVSAENDSELLTPESIKKLESAYHTAIRGNKEFETEIEAIAKDGKILTLHIKAVIEKDGKKPVKMLATCQDITSRKDHLEHIEYISYHDQLTGLYNRRFLEEELNRLDVLRNYPLAVIMADVNGLKLANDTFGHAEGDRMLVNA